jgi:Domain of unknown function (DUF4249)
MKRLIILSLSTVLLLFACQKTVTLPLNTAPTQLVIQGEVTNMPGPYTVTINQTVGFYADNTFPTVSGASVLISDNTGVTDNLTETSPGTYTTHTLQGRPGNTYTLSVTVNDSNYTAISTMPQPVNLDSVTFTSSGGRFGGKSSVITPDANFQDPPDSKNYYQFMLYINGTQFTKNIYAFSDRLSSGKYVSVDLRMDSSYLSVGDQLQVNMYCIDVNVYNYFNQLSQSIGVDAFNTGEPANPSTNISNGAYGVFSAHTVSSKTLTVY